MKGKKLRSLTRARFKIPTFNLSKKNFQVQPKTNIKIKGFNFESMY